MNGLAQDPQDLALAIHLHRCQSASRMRNRDLRALTDAVQNINEIMELPINAIMDLILESAAAASDNSSHKPEVLHQSIKELIRLFTDHSARQDALATARTFDSFKIKPLVSGDPCYPNRLKSIDSSPAILYTRGPALAAALDRPLWVTVIGTRNPTVYGQRVTQVITRDLAARGTVIVSGLARGIDTLAHEIALEQNGLTIAVTGCGLDQVYPPENARLMQRIADHGVLISEHPPGVEPRRQHFPARNRILSGLSDVVAVMEAAQRSGTLITAGFAGDQGRDVFAVPGNILDQASSGCHQLIRDGAKLLEQASDIFRDHPVRFVQELIASAFAIPGQSGRGQEQSLTQREKSSDVEPSSPSLNDVLQQNSLLASRILQILRGQTLTLDQLADLSGQPVRDVITAASFLELGGLIICHRGRYALTASGQCSI
ncbi:MAG: dprA [Firmicutes bacterium]|nr:dprA [Bacillota bacterium]